MTNPKHALLLISAVALLPGCAAISTGAAIMDAGVGVAGLMTERANEARRPLGLLPSDFTQLRIGMSEANLRIAIGDPIQSTITPEGWVCHTLGPVLAEGGEVKDAAAYTDYWKVLMVDRGEGNVVAGWAAAGASDARPNCEGI